MSAVDEFVLDSAPPATPPRRRSRPRGPALWVAGAVVLTLVGVIAAPAGGLPPRFPDGQVGTLAIDLSVPPQQVWSTPLPGWKSGDEDRLMAVDDVLVALSDEAIGLDLATGAELWRLNVNTSRCQVGQAVVCIDRTSQVAAVLRVDPRTGTFEWHRMADAITAVDVGADLLIVRGDRNGQLLERIDAVGAAQWQRDLPDLAASGDPNWRSSISITVLGDRALVGGATPTTVDVATGTPVDTEFTWVVPTGAGEVGYRDDGTLALLDAQGRVVVDHLLTVPDDDPGSPTTVTRPVDEGDALAVTDRGVELWSAPSEWVAARVDGILLTVSWSAETTTAHEVRTGEVLWQREEALTAVTASEDTVIAAPSYGAGTLSGIDVRSGEVLWSFGTAVTGYPSVLLPDGVCVIGDGEVTRLRWDIGRG